MAVTPSHALTSRSVGGVLCLEMGHLLLRDAKSRNPPYLQFTSTASSGKHLPLRLKAVVFSLVCIMVRC